MRKSIKKILTQEDYFNNLINIIIECNNLKNVEVFLLSQSNGYATVSINGKEIYGNYSNDVFLNKIMNISLSKVKINYSIPKKYSYLEPEEPSERIFL